MNKEQVNSTPVMVPMVVLPQTVWEETTEKIDRLLRLVDDVQKPASISQQVRIPLIQFKNDTELQQHYGLTYTMVRRITNDNLLRSYCDPGRQRYRWTTHEDIMDYLKQIKTTGVK
jgi:hypothetical protein